MDVVIAGSVEMEEAVESVDDCVVFVVVVSLAAQLTPVHIITGAADDHTTPLVTFVR